jgi:phosphoribosylamine-glycine ligase
VADTIQLAQKNAVDLASRIFTPNVRYRCDIGDRLIAREFAILERLGMFDEISGRS